MKESILHPVYGEIVYTESSWSGKKSLTVNGVNAEKISKREYSFDGKRIILKGSNLTGISLLIEGDAVQLSPKATWYEIALAIIPFLFLMIWGNNPSLCAIFPVVGGAIGGALGGAAAFISLFCMRKQKSILFKLLIGVAVLAVTVLIAYFAASALIKILS